MRDPPGLWEITVFRSANDCGPPHISRLRSRLNDIWREDSQSGGGAIFKRIPCNPFTTKWLGKACFVKGTLIHTKEGLVPIEEIKAGDEVLSYNEQTKQNEYRPVIETYIRQTEEIVKLEIEGESTAIETTQEHPFYVRIHRARDSLPRGDEGEWVEAGKLQIGDEVLSASGQWRGIAGSTSEGRKEQVYNFAVEKNHNYYVGVLEVLVHNECGAYLLEFESGKFYAGKGPISRMNDSVRRLQKIYDDKVVNKTHYPTASDVEAFIKEYQLMKETGYLPLHWDPNSMLYNKIWSPGRSLLGL